MNEGDIQAKIVTVVKSVGGFARKQANRYIAGIPDLYLQLPGFASCDTEVKWLGEVGKTFKRKIETTPLQKKHMADMNAVNPGLTAAFVMVAYKQDGVLYVASVPADAEAITQDTLPCSTLKALPTNLRQHLIAMGVPRLTPA